MLKQGYCDALGGSTVSLPLAEALKRVKQGFISPNAPLSLVYEHAHFSALARKNSITAMTPKGMDLSRER